MVKVNTFTVRSNYTTVTVLSNLRVFTFSQLKFDITVLF